jgi:hypothetical protein
MSKHLVRVLWLAVIGSLLAFGLNFRLAPRPTSQDASELLDRAWVDHMPRTDREPFRAFLFFNQQDPRGLSIGLVVMAQSVYKAQLEAYSHRIDSKDINFLFLHDNVRAVSPYKLEHVKPIGDDLDLKLTLARDPRNNGQSTVYYSSSSWRDLPAFVQHALRPDLVAR